MPGEFALEQLASLYRSLPVVTCQGKCGESCHQHVWASIIETQVLADRGVDLAQSTATGACPALTRSAWGQERCSVHDVRPMICRLWGAAEAMPCPHGCVVEGGPLGDAETLGRLLDSLEVGGSGDNVAGMRELLQRAQADPRSAGLLAGFLRGDRSGAAELAHRLKPHRLA